MCTAKTEDYSEVIKGEYFFSVRSLRVISFSICLQSSFIHVICSFNFRPIVTLNNTLPSVTRPLCNKRHSP